MTLKELGEEYLNISSKLLQRVKEIKSESQNLTDKERMIFNRRIKSLLTSAVECKKTGEFLVNYYKEKENGN